MLCSPAFFSHGEQRSVKPFRKTLNVLSVTSRRKEAQFRYGQDLYSFACARIYHDVSCSCVTNFYLSHFSRYDYGVSACSMERATHNQEISMNRLAQDRGNKLL